MRLFYFDIEDGKVIRDGVGTRCADLDAARMVAIHKFTAVLRDSSEIVWDSKPWMIVIRDDKRQMVSSITFIAS